MSKTVIATPWHNNKAIISLNNQTFRGPLAAVKSACIDHDTGCQIKNYVLKGLDFMFGIWNVQDSEYTG